MTAKGLANAYSQSLGNIFTAELKPYECEILVAAVGDSTETNELFHILFDGSVTDRTGWVAMGGQSEDLSQHLEANYSKSYPDEVPDLQAAARMARDALTSLNGNDLPAQRLEVAVLDRTLGRRKFKRLKTEEVGQLL